MLSFENFDFYLIFFIFILLYKIYDHYLEVLLVIEFMVLIVLSMMVSLMKFFYNEYLILGVMVMFVIESAMGLCLLIELVNFKENDFLKNLNLLLW